MARKRPAAGSRLEWTAMFLALFGYLPFAFLTLLLAFDPGLVPYETGGAGVDALLKAYAAIILSFLGGLRWGVVLARPGEGREAADVLLLAVVPSLVGWFAFFLAAPWTYAVFAAAFAVMGWWDDRLVGRGTVPRWFGRLRMLLTVLVTGTLITAFVATF